MLSRQLTLTSTVIQVDGVSVGASYDIPLGNPALYINEMMEFLTIGGSATLANSLSITSSSTPTASLMFTFVSFATINLNGNTITIFGTSLTQLQASNPFVIHVTYSVGTGTWTSVLSRVELPAAGLPNSSLATMPANTMKMNSGATDLVPQDVTLANVRTKLNVEYDHIYLVVNFNSGAISPGSYRQDILIPYQGEVTRVFGYVSQQIAGGDDAIVSFGIASSAGGGVGSFYDLTVPANDASNSVYTVLAASFSGPSTFSQNWYLAVEAQKATWGGQAIFTIVTKRT